MKGLDGDTMNDALRAVLSKREEVQPDAESWATEIAWRANYDTTKSELQHAIDEIVRLHKTLLLMREQRKNALMSDEGV